MVMAVRQPTAPCPTSTSTGTPADVFPVPHLRPAAAATGDCVVEDAAAGLAEPVAVHPVSAHPASAATARTAGPAGRQAERRMEVSFRAPHHAVIRLPIRGRLPMSPRLFRDGERGAGTLVAEPGPRRLVCISTHHHA